jgi:CRISPR-associated protein Cmr1
MPLNQYKLMCTSPIFINGADKNAPEPRAASARGQLRYWFRALEGAVRPDRQELWERESGLLGSTEGASKVSVRFYSRGELRTAEKEMLPHRSSARDRSPQNAILENNHFTLEFSTRPGLEIPPRLEYTMFVWLLLGGIGKRSRRMFGGFGLDWTGEMLAQKTPQGLAELINKRIGLQVKNPPAMPQIPAFPTLHPNHSRVLVGTKPYNSHQDLVVSLFRDILRQQKFIANERSFGYAMRGRRASPLIAQARELNGKFYPVLTVMRSKPDQDIKWDVVKEMMNDAQKLWNGVEAWGNWR